MAMRVCLDCPALTKGTRCEECARRHDRARGTSTARGYGRSHRAERRRWAVEVAQGHVRCARCGRLIAPDTAWDLDHTDDRTGYLGPSHAACNRATAGRAPAPPGSPSPQAPERKPGMKRAFVWSSDQPESRGGDDAA